MKKNKTARFTIRLTENELHKLGSMAGRVGVSRSKAARLAIRLAGEMLTSDKGSQGQGGSHDQQK
jgi:hypothetical protein